MTNESLFIDCIFQRFFFFFLNLAVKCKPAHSSIPSLTIKQCIENKTSLCFQLYPVEWKRREKKKETEKTKSKSN